MMSNLLHTLGLSTALQIHDVFSLEDTELLGFIPRPALAVLLVFPVSAAYESHRLAEDVTAAEYAGKGEGEPVIWFKQTIRNACGLMGLLHATANGPAKAFIGTSLFFSFVFATFLLIPKGLFFSRKREKKRSEQSTGKKEDRYVIKMGLTKKQPSKTEKDSDLDKLLKAAVPLAPAERSRLLETDQSLARAHHSAASQGATAAPDAQDDIDLHYVCFVKTNDGTLWELDGRRKGPIVRGRLEDDEDVLSQKALLLGPLKFLGREGADLRFSCVALAGGLE